MRLPIPSTGAVRHRIATIAILTGLLFAMDQLYRILHPEVNFVRAGLVGATAWATLRGLERLGARWVSARLGGAAVFLSAFGSVAAIESGWLVSRSATSVVVHVALLAAAALLLERVLPPTRRRSDASTAHLG